MSLSEHLLYRDIQDLHRMAETYQCDCNKNSKLELVQAIHYKMLNRSFFLSYVQELDESFIAFSTYIIFQPSRMFSVEELMAKGSYVMSFYSTEANPRKWISQLMSNGWLFPVTSKNHIQLEIPIELCTFLRKEWVNYWLKQMPNACDSLPIETVRKKEDTVIVSDLRLFISKLAEEPYPLTIDGSIHKKALTALLSLMSVQESPLLEGNWRFGYGRRFPHYPSRFALIYDYCFYKGWIAEDENQVYVTKLGQQDVNEGATDVIRADFREYWMRLYRKPIPALPFMVTIIMELCRDRWILGTDMFQTVKKWIKHYYYDDQQAVFEQRIMQPLIYLGYLEVALDAEKQQHFFRSCV